MDAIKETVYMLEPMQELRFISNATGIEVKLVTGRAEHFGSALVCGQTHAFIQTAGAIFSFNGCSLVITADDVNKATIYISSSEMMKQVINTCACLNVLKKARIMLVGNPDSGTSTLSKTLCNYSVRMGLNPLFIDLDVDSSLNLCGTISATKYKSGASKLCMFVGATQVSDDLNRNIFVRLCEKLASCCEKKTDIDTFIIHSKNVTTDVGYALLLEQARIWKLNAIVVVGSNETLAHTLRRDLSSQKLSTEVVNVAKSSGVVQKTTANRKEWRQKAFLDHFSASFRHIRKYTDLRCFRMIDGSHAPASALPLGKKPKISQSTHVDLHVEDVIHQVVGLIFSSSSTTDGICSIDGIAHVVENDTPNQQLIFITCGEKLPAVPLTLLFGTLKWIA